MQHRNNESNAWLITHVNSLLDANKEGEALWEPKCRGKGNTATLYSNAINNKPEAETYQQYLAKKGITCTVETAGDSNPSFRIIIPVARQQMKKTRFNTTHTDVTHNESIEKILAMLNGATPPELGKWEVTSNHSGQRMLSCLEHRKIVSVHDDDAHLTSLIDTILAKGAFSEESRRSIRHYFLDNLYIEIHENYTMYSIIDLAFMEQIETIESMSQ